MWSPQGPQGPQGPKIKIFRNPRGSQGPEIEIVGGPRWSVYEWATQQSELIVFRINCAETLRGPEVGPQGPDRDEMKTINPDMLVPDRSGGVPGPKNPDFGKIAGFVFRKSSQGIVGDCQWLQQSQL